MQHIVKDGMNGSEVTLLTDYTVEQIFAKRGTPQKDTVGLRSAEEKL